MHQDLLSAAQDIRDHLDKIDRDLRDLGYEIQDNRMRTLVVETRLDERSGSIKPITTIGHSPKRGRPKKNP